MHIVFKCKNLICACTLGSFLILFTAPLCAHLYFIFLDVLFRVNDNEVIRMPCLCILYSNANYIVHKPWGVSSYHLKHSFRSYHNIYISFGIFLCPIGISVCQLVRWIFGLLASLVEAFTPCYLFAIFYPQYSLIPSKYSSLDRCI